MRRSGRIFTLRQRSGRLMDARSARPTAPFYSLRPPPITQEEGCKSSRVAGPSSIRTATWPPGRSLWPAPRADVQAAVSCGDGPRTGSQEIRAGTGPWRSPGLRSPSADWEVSASRPGHLWGASCVRQAGIHLPGVSFLFLLLGAR